MKKLKKILSMNVFQYVYYNFFCKNVIRDKNCHIIPSRGTKIELHKTARIILHANLFLNLKKLPHSHAECYLRLKKGAEMVVNGNVRLYYNAIIDVRTNGQLSIGKCNINSGAVITCAYKMTIGNNCGIARYCVILDSDLHQVVDDEGKITNSPREVSIGDNVWLGVKSTVLRGTKIKNGGVVGANSLVIGRVKEKTLVMNEPAREISKINWLQKGFEDN